MAQGYRTPRPAVAQGGDATIPNGEGRPAAGDYRRFRLVRCLRWWLRASVRSVRWMALRKVKILRGCVKTLTVGMGGGALPAGGQDVMPNWCRWRS